MEYLGDKVIPNKFIIKDLQDPRIPKAEGSS